MADSQPTDAPTPGATVSPDVTEVTVTLARAHYDLLFRCALHEACRGMKIAKDEMKILEEQADLHEGSRSEDVREHLRILFEDLAVLDVLGWPEWRSPARPRPRSVQVEQEQGES